MLSFYQILQVEETATEAEIKQAYRKLSKVLHPDLNNNTVEANTLFRLLQEAYETLSDPLKRNVYDKEPTHSSDNQDLQDRIESYKKQNQKQRNKLEEYEKELKDYKDKVYRNSNRERALSKEIDLLTKRILELEEDLQEKGSVEKEFVERKLVEEKFVQKEEQFIHEEVSSNNEKGISLSMIIFLIIGVNLVLFLVYFAISMLFDSIL